MALEYKLDGARVQIHKKGDVIRIYSRRLKEVTQNLPEIVRWVKTGIKAREAVLEGEVIAVDENTRPLPFQHLMRPFRRVHDVQATAKEIPVELHLFDLLYFDGLTDEEFEKMTNRLKSLELSRRGGMIFVRPKVVVRVLFNEIQASPKYKSGFALRFARITKIWDKTSPQIDSLQRVERLFEEQFRHKGKRATK